MPDVTTIPPIAQIESDEWGDTYWAPGHLTPEQMVLAMAVHLATNHSYNDQARGWGVHSFLTNSYPGDETHYDEQVKYANGLLECTSHVWMVDTEDGRVEVPKCPGAHPYTRFER